MKMAYNIDDMYKYTKANNYKLLSEFPAAWWSEYRTNYQKFDQIFRRKYKSFRFFLQDSHDTLANNVIFFTNEVYSHLLANSKKYEELYRINVLDDSTYSLLDNYNLTEVMAKTTTDSSTMNQGQRIDSDSDSYGAATNTMTVGSSTNKNISGSTPFDIPAIVDGFSQSGGGIVTDDIYLNGGDISTLGSHTDQETRGARTDTSSHTKGSQQDTTSGSGSENYTLTRTGNIGIQTPTDILDKHKNFWSIWDFYDYVFSDICKELLEVTD